MFLFHSYFSSCLVLFKGQRGNKYKSCPCCHNSTKVLVYILIEEAFLVGALTSMRMYSVLIFGKGLRSVFVLLALCYVQTKIFVSANHKPHSLLNKSFDR